MCTIKIIRRSWAAMVGLALIGFVPASLATQSPPGCSANNLIVNIGKSAANVTNGATVTFTITVQNPPTNTSCDLTLGTNGLVFHPPGGDGAADGTPTTLLPPGFTITNGFGPTNFILPAVINITNGTITANATVVDPGAVLHDNTLQDDGAAITKSISVNVFRPCISVTKNCLSATNINGTSVVVTFSGTVTNCGDVILTNVIVFNNQPSPGTVVVGPTSLSAGAGIAFTASYTNSQDICGPFNDTLTGIGTAPLDIPAHVTNSASSFCTIQYSPCIGVTKICSEAIAGAPQTVSGVVTNCGDIALTNISVSDSVIGSITNVALLPRGGSFAYSKTVTAVCPGNTNVVTATGFSACGGSVTAHATNVCIVTCLPPNICVTKQVACFEGFLHLDGPQDIPIQAFCGFFTNLAVGVSGDKQNPAFCYQITISNCGPVNLTNVTVIDNQYGDFTTNFFPTPAVFPIGGSITYTFKSEVGHNLTNTVTVSGQSALTGEQVTASDHAVVKIIPASISCNKQYTIDGGPLTNGITLPDQNSHTIVWAVTVVNPSQVNLENISLTDLTTNLGCTVSVPNFSLMSGSNITIFLCTNTVACSNGFVGITHTIQVSNDVFSFGTNRILLCAHDLAGSNIVVSSECDAELFCGKPEGCRVTGGGRQDAPLVYPPNVRYVTHGGQVGAPVGDHICIVTTNFPIGNPCIHGRWEHVRHMQSGNQGNFHARFYDTLECACLDTNTSPVVVTNGAQIYTNLVYGPGTTVDGLCNPDNNPAGPQPRPAPSNKIAFSGVGDYAETKGRRVPVSVLFRIDIEDRSEPGGSKPKGGKPPPDRNRTRIWILKPAELVQLHSGSGADPYLLSFRNAISACNGIDVQDGASVPNGAAAFGVRPPDIDDGGALTRGNYQLHPSIKECDPNNPTGPGLANP